MRCLVRKILALLSHFSPSLPFISLPLCFIQIMVFLMTGVRGKGDKEMRVCREREERRRRAVEEGGFVGTGFFGREKMKRKGGGVQKLATKERGRDSEEIKRMTNAAFVPFYVAFHVLVFLALGAMFHS
jgi:hypothetical protein